ncbi:MAG: class I SAM-dependent methyltransferase [Chloroflexota bacterium]
MFAEEPTWLHEAYESSIADQDIGLIGRNVRLSAATQLIARSVFPGAERFVDFGAGTGMFVRMMRDAGYDFRYVDPHGPNLYAKTFEVEDGVDSFQADVVTAFEVLEHLVDPVATLAPVIRGAVGLIATTELLPDPPPSPEQWWYYSLSTGQHVTFFTEKAMGVLAERLGMRSYSSRNLHVLARHRISKTAVRAAAHHRIAGMMALLRTRQTLLDGDYERLTGERFRR